MKTKTSKILRYTLGGGLIITMLLYLIGGYEWARLPFYLMLLVVSLYNLFFNRPKGYE